MYWYYWYMYNVQTIKIIGTSSDVIPLAVGGRCGVVPVAAAFDAAESATMVLVYRVLIGGGGHLLQYGTPLPFNLP